MRSKGHKAIILALLALLVVVVRGARVQRQQLTGATPITARQVRRAHRRASRRLLAVMLGISLPGIPNPWDWIKDKGGSVAGDIKDLIASMIDTALGWVHSAFDIASSALTAVSNLAFDAISRLWSFADALGVWFEARVQQVIGWAWSTIQSGWAFLGALIDNVRSWAASAIGALGSWLTSLIDNVRSWAGSALNALGSWLSSLIDNVRSWAGTALGALGSFLGALIDNVRSWAASAISAVLGALWSAVSNVSSWVLGLLDDLRGWVQSAIEAAWGFFYDNVISPIEDDLGNVVDWIEREAKAVIHVVEDVWDWLVKLADYPYDEARAAWDEMRHLLGRHALERAGGSAGWIGELVRDASKRHVG